MKQVESVAGERVPQRSEVWQKRGSLTGVNAVNRQARDGNPRGGGVQVL